MVTAMATADQIKSLIKAHLNQDNENLKQQSYRLQHIKSVAIQHWPVI